MGPPHREQVVRGISPCGHRPVRQDLMTCRRSAQFAAGLRRVYAMRPLAGRPGLRSAVLRPRRWREARQRLGRHDLIPEMSRPCLRSGCPPWWRGNTSLRVEATLPCGAVAHRSQFLLGRGAGAGLGTPAGPGDVCGPGAVVVLTRDVDLGWPQAPSTAGLGEGRSAGPVDDGLPDLTIVTGGADQDARRGPNAKTAPHPCWGGTVPGKRVGQRPSWLSSTLSS